jgi:hypothetical protein
LKEEVAAGRFKPRKEVPLRVAPMKKSEVSIYFNLVGIA